jgi:Phage integrase, N-terminal SAM-like domain
MASAWVRKIVLPSSAIRYRVIYRLGGRDSKRLYGGSFRTAREAEARRRYITDELAAKREPDLTFTLQRRLTLGDAAKRWQESRVDVADGTLATYRTNVERIGRVLGDRDALTLTAADVAKLVTTLHGEGLKRESIRKTRSTLAMVLDFVGLEPNPARDTQRVKLPREEPEEPSPPTAEHIEGRAEAAALEVRSAHPLARLQRPPRNRRSRQGDGRRLRRGPRPRASQGADDEDSAAALDRVAARLGRGDRAHAAASRRP